MNPNHSPSPPSRWALADTELRVPQVAHDPGTGPRDYLSLDPPLDHSPRAAGSHQQSWPWEVPNYLPISTATVTRWIRSGLLPNRRVGCDHLIALSDVRALGGGR